jgi:hypothetical protein
VRAEARNAGLAEMAAKFRAQGGELYVAAPAAATREPGG